MKRFFIQLTIEYTVLLSAAVMAALLVRGGHPALGLTVIALYGAITLLRLDINKINAEYSEVIKEAQLSNLNGHLQLEKARKRRLELAFIDAASETLWVSDVTRDGVYTIETPNHGCFVITTSPSGEDTESAETDATPAASEKG